MLTQHKGLRLWIVHLQLNGNFVSMSICISSIDKLWICQQLSVTIKRVTWVFEPLPRDVTDVVSVVWITSHCWLQWTCAAPWWRCQKHSIWTFETHSEIL